MSPSLRITAFAGLAVCSAFSFNDALSQPSDADQTSRSGGTSQLDVITVTAQRRVENAQDVPISMTVFSEKDIEERGAASVRDLQYAVPNLSFTGANAWTAPNVSVRGIQSGQENAGFESPLAVYVDGIYVGNPADVDLDLAGVQSVNVLLGPQGTLFGRNVTAGAILVNMAKPTDELGGRVYLEGGSFDHAKVSGTLNVPLISHQLDMRIDAAHTYQDGYVTNLHDNKKFGGSTSDSVRTQLRWDPNEALTVDLSGDYYRQTGSIAWSRVTDVGAPGYTSGMYDVDIDGPNHMSRTLKGLRLNADYRLPGGATLTSLTGARWSASTFQQDYDSTPFAYLTQDNRQANDELTQEFRLTSDNTASLRYVVGLYYINESLRDTENVKVGPDYPLPPGSEQLLNVHIVTNGYAAFGQVDYDALPDLTLSLGMRETYEKKNLTYSQKGIPLLGIPDFSPFGNSQSDSAFTPSGSATYHVNRDVNVYAKVSSGFKAGGFNSFYPPASVGTPNLAFGPEHVTNYEIGLKSDFLDHRLRVNQSIYYANYRDMQVQEIFQTYTTISNAGKATLKGTELQIEALPLEGLMFSAGVGYSRAYFVSYKNAGGPGIDYDGNNLPNAPRWTFNTVGQYQFRLGPGKATTRIDYSFRDSVNGDPGANPVYEVKSLSLVNARLAWATDSNYEVALWGKNLADKVIDVLPTYSNLGSKLATYNLRRTFGVSLSKSFSTRAGG